MKNLNELSGKVVNALRGDDAVTIGQLRALLGSSLGASMVEMTMGEFLGAKPAKAKRGRGKAKAKPAKAASEEVKTRTSEQREAYDKAVLAFVRSSKNEDGVSSKEIRKACGGDAHQVRATMKRLIDDGNGPVTWDGQAAGMRYMLAG